MQSSLPQRNRVHSIVAVIFLLVILVNPIIEIDLILLMIALLYFGHIFLREKLLLVFLALRPTLDTWRDVSLGGVAGVQMNINAGFSMIIALWGIFMLATHLQRSYRIPGLKIAMLLLVLMFGSTMVSIVPMETALESVKFLVLIILFVLGFIFIGKKYISLRELTLSIVVGSIIPIAFGIFQLFFGKGITTFDIRDRIFGTFAHPNVFAFFIVSLLFIHIHHAYIDRTFYLTRKKLYAHLITLFLLILLACTFTRGAWVGLGIFLVVIGLAKFRKFLGILALGTLILYLIFSPLNQVLEKYTNFNLERIQLIQRLTTRDEEADSISWRQNLISESVPIFLARPWYGYGYGSFPRVWENEQSPLHIRDDSTESHNDYLRFAIELGTIGLFTYLLFLWLLVWNAGKFYLDQVWMGTHALSIHLLGWIIAFGVMSLGDNMLHHTPVMWMTWVWWGAMFGVLYREKKETFNFIRNSEKDL